MDYVTRNEVEIGSGESRRRFYGTVIEIPVSGCAPLFVPDGAPDSKEFWMYGSAVRVRSLRYPGAIRLASAVRRDDVLTFAHQIVEALGIAKGR